MNSMDLKYLKSNLLLTLDVLVLLNSSGVLVGIFGRKLYDHEKRRTGSLYKVFAPRFDLQ